MPKIVVETGVATGASSFLILNAIKLNKIGTLYSIDLPNKNIIGNREVGFVVPKELRNNWKLILGDSKTELPKLLSELKQIDIFFHDSLHTYEHMMFEFETAWPHIKEKGLIISDDIYWNNAFIDFAKKVNSQYITFNGIGIIKKNF
jgi:predicted O-methyltransferase YrrM